MYPQQLVLCESWKPFIYPTPQYEGGYFSTGLTRAHKKVMVYTLRTTAQMLTHQWFDVAHRQMHSGYHKPISFDYWAFSLFPIGRAAFTLDMMSLTWERTRPTYWSIWVWFCSYTLGRLNRATTDRITRVSPLNQEPR